MGEVLCQMKENKLHLKEVIEELTCEFDSNLRNYEENALVTAKTFYHRRENRIDSLTKSYKLRHSHSKLTVTSNYKITRDVIQVVLSFKII